MAAREVIAYGTDILNSGVKITRRIRQMLEDNPTVQQNWGANDESIFSIGAPEQATNNRDGESENKDEHADSSAERGAEQIIVLFTAEQRPTHHHAGIRIGEAKNPGPETDNPSSYIVVYRDGTIAADVDVYANETTPTPARQFLTASMLLDTGTNPELPGTAEAIHVVAELDAYDQPNAPTSSESKSDSDDEPPPLLMNVQRRPDVPDSDGDMPELVESTSEEDAPEVDTDESWPDLVDETSEDDVADLDTDEEQEASTAQTGNGTANSQGGDQGSDQLHDTNTRPRPTPDEIKAINMHLQTMNSTPNLEEPTVRSVLTTSQAEVESFNNGALRLNALLDDYVQSEMDFTCDTNVHILLRTTAMVMSS